MTSEELLERMRGALAEERAAIRRLDAEAVTRAAEAKEALIAQVSGAPTSERAPLVAALGTIRRELQHNLLLLAHARRYLHEAVEACARPERGIQLEARL